MRWSRQVVDEYVDMVRRNFDSGPHALAGLGLEQLGEDKLIREAINEMKVRTGRDPWGRDSELVAKIDLVEFFSMLGSIRLIFHDFHQGSFREN